MKQLLAFLFVLIFILGFSLQAQAELFNRGTDNAGHRLIYDSDFNITWYDFTNPTGMQDEQYDWASTLAVTFNGTIFDDWRLPSALNSDGSGPCGGICNDSEMGHLYYIELGNSFVESGLGTPNTGPFTNLQPVGYWSKTRVPSSSNYYLFDFSMGVQGYMPGSIYDSHDGYGLAVRSGDVAVVPEPISSILFLTGGATLIGRKYIRRKKIEV
jgi:hypothetical protein